jgi:hypothetical protein
VPTQKKIKFVDYSNTTILFIDIDNKAWALGGTQGGKLGIGNWDVDLYYVSIPTPIKNIPNAKYLSCNVGHSAVIDMNGRLWMFGSNDNGSLGINAAELEENGQFTRFPIMVKSIENAVKVKCYSDKTVVMTADGKVYESYYGRFRDYLEIPEDRKGYIDNVNFSGYKCINICQPDRTILCEDAQGIRYMITGNGFDRHSRWSRPVPSGTIDVLTIEDNGNYFLDESGEVTTDNTKIRSGKIPNPVKEIIIEEPTIFGTHKQVFSLNIPFVSFTAETGSYPNIFLLDRDGNVYTTTYDGGLQRYELPYVVKQIIVGDAVRYGYITILAE